MQKTLLYVWVVATALSFAQCAEAETAGQEARTNAVIMEAENPQTLKQPNTIQSNTAIDQVRIQEKLDSYAKQIDVLRWAVTSVLACVGFVITLAFAAVGFISWKSQKEYRDALGDVKEAIRDAKEFARKAEEFCSKCEEWERKSQEAFNNIDAQAKEKLKELSDKTEEKLKELDEKAEHNIKILFEEANKQRDISRKWFDALNASQERDFELANKLWEEITQENPKDYEAFYHWGITLASEAEDRLSIETSDIKLVCEKFIKALEINPKYYPAMQKWAKVLSYCTRNIDIIPDDTEAEKYLKLACEKCEQALSIKPDDSNIYIDWGRAYGGWAIERGGTNREEYFNLADEKFRKAEKIKAGSAAYFLASLWAERGNIENCKEWLIKAEKSEALPTFEQAQKNENLSRVHHLEWFKKMNWKKEKEIDKEPM